MNYAIDENVLAVANDIGRILSGKEPICTHASDLCRLASVDFLESALSNARVLIDTDDIVFGYYRRKASMAGQPGSGDAFLMALYQSSYDDTKVKRIVVDNGIGNGLPEDFVNCGFDKDDMIYVALAKSVPGSAVVNAVDSDYSEYSEQLSSLGVEIKQICK